MFKLTVIAGIRLKHRDTTRVAVCNQAQVLAGSARHIETLDAATADQIVNRLVSVLEPG